MNITQPRTFLSAAVIRLTATYLAIIMTMSIGFSLVFYTTSSHQLDRQLPWSQAGQSTFLGRKLFSPYAMEYLQQQVSESRAILQQELVLLNLAALGGGGILSYLLARRTLRPVENALAMQQQFVSDASHELRTPLTAIQTTHEVALRQPDLTLEAAKELIKKDIKDIKYLRGLSDGLLDLASQTRIDRGRKSIVGLHDIVSEAMTQVAPQAVKKDIIVQDEVAKLSVLGDKESLVRLLLILLDNAVKYSHNKGVVRLTTQKKGKYVYLAVRDEGIGIDANDLPHIFQRFYRADNARSHSKETSGYGLGLSIAEHIATSHHGTISATSDPDKGSTFTVKLPLA